MFINRRRGEINLKIVYYGPALSGKTTNLQQVYARTRPDLRGELVSLKTREDRTVFFDYLLLELGQIAGLKPKFNLYTVPGQTYYAASRKLVLQGVDGLVFVVDSQPHRLKDSMEALVDLYRYLRELGLDPQRVPLVAQFNKRDLPRALPVPLLAKVLQLNGSTPYFEAVAATGAGVFDTLKAIINQVVGQIQTKA
jgi:signal recognition particle receptor subunit beta